MARTPDQRRRPHQGLLYTALHRGPLAELVAIRLDDVDLDGCRIRITRGKGGKDSTVPHLNGVTVVLAVTRPHSLLRSYHQESNQEYL